MLEDDILMQRLRESYEVMESSDDQESFEKVEFTTGGCPYFAFALHERTGWPLYYEWLKSDPSEFIHGWVVNPEGKAVDISGIHSSDYAETEYSEPKLSEYGPASSVNDIVDIRCTWNKHGEEYYNWSNEIIDRNPTKYGIKN